MNHPDPSGPAEKPGEAHPPTLTARRKRPEDTPEGCRELAAADLRRAEAHAAEHVRWRYRCSADAWLARAELLDRLEAQFQKRVGGVEPLGDHALHFSDRE